MLTSTPDGRTTATVATDTRHRFGSLTPHGTPRVCAVLTREGYGHVTPTVSRGLNEYGHAFGGFHTPHVHGTDVCHERRFVTVRAARNALAELRNRADAAQHDTSPAYRRRYGRGANYTGPTAVNVFDTGDRVTVNFRSRDGVNYWHDVSMIDYGAAGFRHVDGVREVGDLRRYLAARRGDPFTSPTVDVVTCGACGRSWDDAVVSGSTPTPAARCPFEYDHGRPFAGWYSTYAQLVVAS